MTYTNELEVEIDFSDVDPMLLNESSETSIESVSAKVESNDLNSNLSDDERDSEKPNVGLGIDKPKSAGVGSKFFKK